jgi:2-polyprenyl-3-methyl-5-hydroxy-6-metoxy-1,4-benzoquinol methylase
MIGEDRKGVLSHSRRYYARRAYYYDLIAQRTRVDKETDEQLDFIESAFKTHAKRPVVKVLDVACGGGRHIVGLAKRGYECTGYDFAAERVKMAEARVKRAGVKVTLRQGDATRLPKGGRYDAVLALFIIFLLPSDDDIKKCLRGVREVLSPGGVLISNIYNPFTRTRKELMELLDRGTFVDEIQARGIHIMEVNKLKDFDPVEGVIWSDEIAVVEAPDGRHIFRDKERYRMLTFWDVKRYLEDAGFKEVVPYAGWKVDYKRKSEAEQIVFVAR